MGISTGKQVCVHQWSRAAPLGTTSQPLERVLNEVEERSRALQSLPSPYNPPKSLYNIPRAPAIPSEQQQHSQSLCSPPRA